MAVGPPESDWREVALEWALKVAMSPIWVLAIILDDFQLRARTRPLVRVRVEDAWEQCRAVWLEDGVVCQFAAHHGAEFGHELAVAMAHRHRRERAFFLSRVADPNPLLAAYAFKCLVRLGKLRREELPAGALQRVEPIKVQWADLVNEEPLGEYLEGWFREQEWLARQQSA